MSRTITGRQAIGEAITEEMERDPSIVYYGEDVSAFGGVFGTTGGLVDRFGSERVFDVPISETTQVGAALGMAITGLRPVVEFQFADFVGIAMDEIANKLGKWRYMHGGQFFKVPVTLRLPVGIIGGAGPEHSQSPQALFLNQPGILLAVPSSPAELKGLLKSAIRSNNPVLFFEHKLLYDMKGEVPDGDYLIPLGQADVKRAGTDLTLVATSYLVNTALNAAETLSREGVSAEVIDLRTLAPLDEETLLASVRRTGRLVVVHEEPKRGGSGAEIAALAAEHALYDLKAPVVRLGSPDVPIAQSMHLEQFYRPTKEDIVAAAHSVMSA